MIPMFRIAIKVESRAMKGLVALDERRRLGLPEDSELQFLRSSTGTIEVSEGFARLYFPPTEVLMYATVPLRALVKGEVVTKESSDGHCMLADGMTPERQRELFAAAHARTNSEDADADDWNVE